MNFKLSLQKQLYLKKSNFKEYDEKIVVETPDIIKRAEKLASDVPGLKNKLASISDRDFNKMLGSLPPEKAAEIFEMLNKKS